MSQTNTSEVLFPQKVPSSSTTTNKYLDPRISSKVRPAELIIACAIVLPDNRLIVSTRGFEECNMLADRFAPGVDWTKAQEGYLTSSGIFVDKDRANKIAYLARQVTKYNLKLEVADLFL